MPSPIAPTPPIPTGLPPNSLLPPLVPLVPMPGRDDPQTLGDAVLDTYGKAVRSADLRGKLDRAIADTSSFPFYVLDKLDKWLKKNHVPWFGDGQGGKQIQPAIPGVGRTGQNPNVTYGWVLEAFFYTTTQDPPNFSGSGATWEGEVNGVCDLTVIDNSTPDVKVYVGTQLVISGNGRNTFIFQKKSFIIWRKDGTSEQADRNQDPNKPPDKPAVIQEPYGPVDTRGAKPSKPPAPPKKPKDPDTKPFPKNPLPPGFPPPIWEGPPIKDPGVPPIDTWDNPGNGTGNGGNQSPQPAPTTTPTRSPASPGGSGGKRPSRPGGGGGGGSNGSRPKKVRRKTRWVDPATGITYEVTEYDDGSKEVAAPTGLNPPGTVLDPDGIKGATDNHDGVKQAPNPGATPIQDPIVSPQPGARPSPTKTDEPKPSPIVKNSPPTIERPSPTQTPVTQERPTPPKPDPVFQPLPTVTPKPKPSPLPTVDPNPTPPWDSPDPLPPIVNLKKPDPAIGSSIPLPSIKDGLRADPVTGNPVSPTPDPEKPKAPPPVNNPGNGGSSCSWPADRGTVIGNQGTIQATQTTHSTIMDGIVNIHIKSVSDKVTNAKELLDKIVRSDVVDRTINLLTLASAIHNSVMLSRELGSTLTEALSNILTAVGIKDAEGNAFDLNDVFGKQLEALIKSIIGVENYTTYKQIWIKSNRILTTASNLLDSIKSQHSAIMQGVEVVANVTSELSNAAKSEGLFNDDLLDFQPNNHDFNTPFSKSQQILQNLNEAGEQINQLASAVIEGQEASAEISKNWTEMNTAIADAKTIKRDLETIKDGQNIPPDSELLDFVRHQAED